MGLVEVKIGVGHPGGGPLTPVEAMVDTGSIHSMLPASLLAQHDLAPLEQRQYALANGGVAEYGFGMARIGIGERELPCPVIFGPEGEYLLGATTLEIFSLMVDPVDGQLLPKQLRARPI